MLPVIQFLALSACAFAANNWATYPSVPKTATLNGFADPIMEALPSCAKDCVAYSVGNTPCPYWDTGCLCVMPQWSGAVAQCFISSCTEATDLAQATAAAYSLCSRVGANIWLMPASISTAMINAASVTANEVSSTSAGSVETGSQSAAITSMAAASGSNNSTSSSTSSAVSSQSTSANAGNSLDSMTSIAALLSVLVLSLLA